MLKIKVMYTLESKCTLMYAIKYSLFKCRQNSPLTYIYNYISKIIYIPYILDRPPCKGRYHDCRHNYLYITMIFADW